MQQKMQQNTVCNKNATKNNNKCNNKKLVKSVDKEETEGFYSFHLKRISIFNFKGEIT
jgi:hypothetical protein